MFDDVLVDPGDAELVAWLSGAQPAWLDEPGQLEPAGDSALIGSWLVELLALPPADRPTGALADLDAKRLSPAARVDLLELLHQQQNWLAAATHRVLAAIEDADPDGRSLSQEVVSLALRVPLRTAQNKLKTAHSL